MTAPTRTLNKKQQELIRLHKLNPTFDLDAALEEFASKPRGRPPAPPKPKVEVKDSTDSTYREGRILLEHLESYVPLVRKTCGQCGRAFLVNYRSCSFCSDVCRAANLDEKYGIVWSPDNSETNRWQYWKVPPSTIRPETLRRLEAFARFILGIDPTEEDLALAQAAESKKVELGKPGLSEPGVQPVASDPRSVPTSSATVPAPISTDKLGRLNEIKKQFADGLISAHELQVELTAALRG